MLIIGGGLLCALILLLLFGNPIITKKENDFGKTIKAISAKTVAFNDIVPFEWDKVYTFDPYTTEQEIEEIIGFESNDITETVSEGMTQLLFIKGNKVVCDICGYSDNLGYNVSFLFNDNAPFQMIEHEDNVFFSVERIDGILALTEE
jgi:hypothetical protein